MATDMDTGGWVSAKERHAMNREKGIATKLNRFDFFFCPRLNFYLYVYYTGHAVCRLDMSICLMKIHCVSMLWLASFRCWWHCVEGMYLSAIGTVYVRGKKIERETLLKWCVHATAVFAFKNAW